MGFNGLVSIVLGVIILIDYPDSAAWAIGLLVGIELMFFGIALISGGRRSTTRRRRGADGLAGASRRCPPLRARRTAAGRAGRL